MYTHLVNVITSYTRMRELAGTFAFNLEAQLKINSQLQVVDQGIDRLTQVIRKDCIYTAKKECLMLQLELVQLGMLIQEGVLA